MFILPRFISKSMLDAFLKENNVISPALLPSQYWQTILIEITLINRVPPCSCAIITKPYGGPGPPRIAARHTAGTTLSGC